MPTNEICVVCTEHCAPRSQLKQRRSRMNQTVLVIKETLSGWKGTAESEAEKTPGCPLPSLNSIASSSYLSRANKTMKDCAHQGHELFQRHPSARRYRQIRDCTSRPKDSWLFIFMEADTLYTGGTLTVLVIVTAFLCAWKWCVLLLLLFLTMQLKQLILLQLVVQWQLSSFIHPSINPVTLHTVKCISEAAWKNTWRWLTAGGNRLMTDGPPLVIIASSVSKRVRIPTN